MSELLIPGRPPVGDDDLPFNRRFFVDQFRVGEAPACSLVAEGGIPVVRLQLVNGESLDIFGFLEFRKHYLVAQVFVDPGECDEFYQTFVPYGAVFRINLHRYPTPDRRLGFKDSTPLIDGDEAGETEG